MGEIFCYICPCLFGLESFIAEEIRALGYKVQAENGRVRFWGDFEAGVRVNMWSRCAERVLILVAEFEALTFEDLFQGTKSVEWDRFIPKDGNFPVKGHSLDSKLTSVPVCQAIIKKAVAEKLKTKYNTDWFIEDGDKYQIQFSIMKDNVTIMIDTTGEGLHKRGYRGLSVEAPLRETLAAAMVKVSKIRPQMILMDPMCGSGTIAIEAALILSNTAPGLNRNFSAQYWKNFDVSLWDKVKNEAKESVSNADFTVYASDSDKKAVDLTVRNSQLAGMGNHVKTRLLDIADLKSTERGGHHHLQSALRRKNDGFKRSRKYLRAYGQDFFPSRLMALFYTDIP